MKTYNDYVIEAKDLLNQIECHQYRIAKIGLEVCEICNGGISDGKYTISNFANDIGMKRKTLSAWILTYRDVLLRLDIDKPTVKQWENGQKTANILKTQRNVDNKSFGVKPGTRTAFKKLVPQETIKKIFEDLENGDTDVVKFDRVFTSTRYNLTILRAIALKNSDRKKLIQVMEWLDLSSDLINDHLSGK